MNNLGKATITTLEIAEMMEVEHKRLLRKLDGDKDRKGYVQILTEAQMGLSDFFIPSTYRDSSGKENKCYEVTKLGCDFLANKFTGEKGVLFTARYVKRFHEMENQLQQIPLTERPDRVAQLINAVSPLMKRNDSTPYDIVRNAQLICEQYGIRMIENFAKVPVYQQLTLVDCK
ncbi:MAG: Rha family transcriptional regulator [Lachnospiraceae bacterium]|nr:Rha family transcriptional regulator [Lachnospiraceae bacterium]